MKQKNHTETEEMDNECRNEMRTAQPSSTCFIIAVFSGILGMGAGDNC